MAPEQVLGVDVTIQADIYSFGIVLYELFTGKKPFEGATVESIFEQILHQPVDRQLLVTATTPKTVIDIIARCTSKKLIERPETLASVVEELQTAASLEAPTPPPVVQVAPGILSPSAQRPPSQVRLAMPPPPDPQKQTATEKPTSGSGKVLLLIVGGAIVVAVLIYAVVNLTAR